MWKQCSYNRDTKIVLYQLPSSVASEEENENEEGSVVQVVASDGKWRRVWGRGGECGAKVTPTPPLLSCWPPNQPRSLPPLLYIQSQPKTLLKVQTPRTTISGFEEYTLYIECQQSQPGKIYSNLRRALPVQNSFILPTPSWLWKNQVLFILFKTAEQIRSKSCHSCTWSLACLKSFNILQDICLKVCKYHLITIWKTI